MGRVIAPHDRSMAPDPAGTDAEAADSAAASTVPPRARRTTKPVALLAATAGADLVGASLWRGDTSVAQSASAAVLAAYRSPVIAEIERFQLGIHNQLFAPLRSVIDQTLGLSRWAQQQNALWRSAFAVPSIPWWTYIDLWPTDSMMTTLMRPLDVVRPQLLDLSRALDNVLRATRWIGQLNADLWHELRRAGQAVAFWAIRGARAALERGDFTALEQFVRDWLDATPTPPMVREHETLLGMRRGAGPIVRITHPEAAVLLRPGLRSGPSLEDTVLNRLQPDVDPRLIELVKDLPPADHKIVVMKTVSGCPWATAAVTCGHPARYGETLRRRLYRRRDGLTPTTEPWSEVTRAELSGPKRATFGRIRTSGVTGGR